MTDGRTRLLRLLANIDQHFAKAAWLTAIASDDEALLRASKQLAEMLDARERTQRLLNGDADDVPRIRKLMTGIHIALKFVGRMKRAGRNPLIVR